MSELVIHLSIDDLKKTRDIGPCMILFYDHDDEIYASSVVSSAYSCISGRKNSYQRKHIGRVEIHLTETKEDAENLKRELPHEVAKRQKKYRALYKPRPRSYLDALPHFVYKHIGANGEVLYVGLTQNLDQRAVEHMKRVWASQIREITSVQVKDRFAGLELEKKLIKQLQPPYNWRHTKSWDGKTPVSDMHPAVKRRSINISA